MSKIKEDEFKGEKEQKIKNNKYCNIIYYNDDSKHNENLSKEIEMFEKETNGAFIFINNISAFDIIINEIYNKALLDIGLNFNLIVTGRSFESIINYLIINKRESCIKYICIFCMDVSKYLPLKEKYNKITLISKSKKDVLENFINYYSDEKNKIFPIERFITYEEYKKEYFNYHLKISLYYGNLSEECYLANLEKIKYLIKEDKSHLIKNEEKLLNSFEAFTLNDDLYYINKKIIKDSTSNSFFEDLNRWLRNIKKYSKEEIAYFTSRFMYSLNMYGIENNKYYTENSTVYRGIRMNLSSLLLYERAKGKIITFSSFISTTADYNIAIKFARKKKAEHFSVVFFIKNIHSNGWISNGIDIHEISKYHKEKEILFQPFTFYILTDIKIDLKEKNAQIYLETIGKNKILEIEMQNGKHIQYNQNLKIMEPIVP